MSKRKRHIGLNELEWEALESIQQEYHFSSLGNAVAFLISNYHQQNSSITQAKLIASVIKEELKPMYDVLRNRFQYMCSIFGFIKFKLYSSCNNIVSMNKIIFKNLF